MRIGVEKKLSTSELRILMAKELNAASKKICKSSMMESSFADVGSDDDKVKFQVQNPGKPLLDLFFKLMFKCFELTLV